MRRNLFYLCNIGIPLLIGTVMYLFCRPDAYISEFIFNLFNVSPVMVPGPPKGIDRFARYYLCDMLWAYALTFSLAFYFGKSKLGTAYIIGLGFIAFMELLQLLSQVPGNFDSFDIIVEFIVCTITIYLIYFYERRNNHEKSG